jgi:sialate O-acetylesterase
MSPIQFVDHVLERIARAKAPLIRALTHSCLLLSCAWGLRAEPHLPHLFSDHMVIQRNIPISIWGSADPGEHIVVRLAANSMETSASDTGQWKTTLPAMPQGGPFTLVVRGKATIQFKDVLIGEVWLASGQSNMTYALSGATGAAEEIPKANYDEIRFFTVPKKIALTPQKDTLSATWQICSPDAAKTFSAVSYFFARDLYKSLKVPIGVILSAWPGTEAEEWTDPSSLEREPILHPILQRWEAAPADAKAFAAQPAEISLQFDDFELLSAENGRAPSSFSNFDDGTSRTGTGGVWEYDWYDSPGTAFDLVAPGRGGKGYAAQIAGDMDGASSSRFQAMFNSDASPADLRAFAGVRFWARGNGLFQVQTLQPTITDWDNYSSPTVRATPDWQQITILFKDLKQDGWGVVHAFTPESLTGITINCMPGLEDPPRPPSGLYDAMIAPLQNYRIRGAIWYQGESNTWRAYRYRTLLPALIEGWRKGWGELDFPFLIVQLPNQGTSPDLGDSTWAELREAQLLTAKTVPHTGLAVSIDVGEEKNLHPPRKAEIGERLALWALGTTYAEKIVYSGPVYDSFKIEGDAIRIRFQHTGGGLEAHGDVLQGFIIAGADRKFHHATARVKGNEVVVSSPDVNVPLAVRYAWANSPECNLYNKEGLPASPFRTDDWPGATADKR